MAKRKTPKIKALRPEKITDVQLNKVQSTVRTMDQLTAELGRLDVQKYGLLKGIENIQSELDLLRREFKEEYGTDNINIQDGAIQYLPENSNENGKTDKKD